MSKGKGNPNWRKGGPSPNPTGKARTDAAPPVEALARADGWVNALTGVGLATRDNRMTTTFAPDIVDYQTATDLWRGDDLAAKVIEMTPGEMLRQGYCIQIGVERKAPLPKPPTGPSAEAQEKAASLKAATAAPKPGPAQRTDADPPEEEPEDDAAAEAEGYSGHDDPGGEGDPNAAMAEAEAQGAEEEAAKELQEDIAAKWEEIGVDEAF